MTNKPKRRWLQFSLRGLMIFCAVVCIWLGLWINSTKQQAVVALILEGELSSVKYENEIDENGKSIAKQDQRTWKYIPLPAACQTWLGKDAQWNVVSATIYNSPLTDLEQMRHLTHLKELTVWDTLISDLTPIQDLEKLEVLILIHIPVTDLSPLASSTNLTKVILENLPVSDISPLKDLQNLEELWMIGVEITEQQVEELQKSIPNCKITLEIMPSQYRTLMRL